MEVSETSRRILASLLEAKTGQQLATNRRWRIETALSSIMRERGYEGIDQLVSRLVARARSGTYAQFEVQRGLPVMQMIRHFEELGGGDWQISEMLRRQVRFEARNLVEPPPTPGRFDIVLCRNVLLYFAPEMRRLAFNRLAEAIAPDGTLMLGAGETVLGQTDRFLSDTECRGLYGPAPAKEAKVA